MSLLPQHAELLAASGVSAELADARGYRTEFTKAELRRLGFKDAQCRVPALLIPLWNLAGQIAGYQLRPDEPRIDPKGRLVKYESVQGSTMTLDVNPLVRQWVADPARPLFITEGVRKADCAASRGLACIALLGVWNWRGSNELGGRTALADWEYVALNQRRVYLVFDSDVMTKPGVHAALTRLKGFLENRGADVLVIYLPCGEGGVKVGLDDFLAVERSVDDLLALATPDLRPAPASEEPDEPQHPYCERSGGIVRLEWKRVEGVDVQIPEPLTNFLARIVADILEDDGEERRRVFEIEATLKGRTQHVPVPSREFNNLNWASEHLGAEALVYPGFGIRDHARAAIQLLSGSIPVRTVYTHLGWRRIEGEWAYLHAGGAIGADEVSVSPTRGLERYRLPEPPDEASVREAVRHSLRFLEIAPRSQTWPLLAAVFTAPLNEIVPCDFTLWLYGESGQRKSTAAALVLCHYGDFDRNHLPANLTSTGNALELQAFAAKDALLVVDDYAPTTDPRTAAQQDQAVHRLLRARGDSRGRNRATADAKLRGERAPRCLPLVTAELPPPGSQSSEARTLEVEWAKGGTNLDRLTQAQQEDARFYPVTLAGFVGWLAPRLEELRRSLPPWIRQAATKFPAAHGRIQETAAKLWAGAEYFLSYARSVNAISDQEFAAYREEARVALAACAVRTGGHQAQRRPTVLFRDYLSNLLIQGRVYVVDRTTGEAPSEAPELWGYTVTESEGKREAYHRPIGDKIGWVDEEAGLLFLLPAAAYRAVVRFAHESEVKFPATQRALGEALKRESLMALPCAEGRNSVSARVEGRTQWVWPLPVDFLASETGDTGDSGDKVLASGGSTHGPDENGASICHHCPSETGDGTGDRSAGSNGRLPAVTAAVTRTGPAAHLEPVTGQSLLPLPTTHKSASNSAAVATVTSSTCHDLQRAAPRRVTRVEQLPALLEVLGLPCGESALPVGMDVETTGLNPRRDRLRLLSLSTAKGTAVIDCFQVDPRCLFPHLAQRRLVGHNLAFDLEFLGRHGFEPGPVTDTMLRSQLLAAGNRETARKGFHALAGVAQRELGVDLPKEQQRSDWGGVLSEAQWEYAARDAAVLLPLDAALSSRIREAGLDAAAEIEERCLPAVAWLGASGVPFVAEAWEQLAAEAEREAGRLREQLDAEAPPPPGLNLGVGWNWDSSALAVRALKAAGCALSDSSDEALAACDHPLAELLRQYRCVQKRVTSYGAAWLQYVDEGRVFADWRQLGAASGRMACRNPGLQQMPRDRRYRACVHAPEGRLLVKGDYSQIELRIAAKISGDERMLRAYDAGADLHAETARALLGRAEVTKADRQLAKAVNFGLLYGMGAATLRGYARTNYGVELTETEAEKYRSAFFRTYPGLARWHRSQPNREVETRTLAGRRRLRVLRFTEKLNTPVQGTGADGLKRALALLWERREECLGACPVLACHDEIVVECEAGQGEAATHWLRQAMVDGMSELAPVPVEVEVTYAPTWGG